MFGFGILSGLVFLPLLGAALVLLQRDDEAGNRNTRWIALWTTLIAFVLSLVAWARFDKAVAGYQLLEKKAWFGHGIVYQLGVDGISMPFLLLTTFLMPICIIASWHSISTRLREYYASFLVL